MTSPSLGSLFDLVDAVFAVNNGLTKAGDRLGADVGMTAAQWQILGLLEHGPDTVASMARRRGMRRQSVQETANRLVAAGMARREPNPADRRGPLLTITDAGDAALDAVGVARDAWLTELGRGLDQAEVDSANRVLTLIRDRLGVPLRDTPNRAAQDR